MRDRYVALIHPPVDGSSWGVTFPDLPNCTSAGRGYEDAIDHAAQALAGHIAALLADGDPVPAARNYGALQEDEEFLQDVREGALPAMITVLDVPAPKERINITIGRDILRRVDEAARMQGVSRSGFLERAAARQAHDLLAATDELQRSLQEIEETMLGRSTIGTERRVSKPERKSA